MNDYSYSDQPVSQQAMGMIVDYYDGKLTEPEVRKLESMLDSDTALRQQFIDQSYFHSQLYATIIGNEFLGETADPNGVLGDEATTSEKSASLNLGGWGQITLGGLEIPPFVFRSVAWIGVPILSCLVVAFACFYLFSFNESSPSSSMQARRIDAKEISIAYIENTGQPKWNELNHALDPNGEIILGKKLRLDSGLAKIVIRNRAEIILEGPAEFCIESPMRARLISGRLSANVLDGGKGFVVRGPGMSVLDLGTAFGMNIGDDGRSQVHVFQGEVEVSLENEAEKDPTHSELVTEYNAVDLDTKQGKIAPLRYDPSRFVRSLEPSDLEIGRDYVAAVKQATPVCYWRFEYFDSQGRIRNEMQDRYHGVSPTRLVLSPDVQNKTLSVDQRRYKKQYMFVKESIEELVDSNYSIEFWFKPDTYHWTTPVMLYCPLQKDKKGEQVTSLVEFLPGAKPYAEQPPRKVRLLHRVPPSGFFTDGVNCYSDCEYQPRNWHHVVGVFDDEESRLYVNGVLVASETIKGKLKKPPLVSIGRTPNVIRPAYRDLLSEMVGQIDEVAIYPQALAEEEIRHHFDIAKP